MNSATLVPGYGDINPEDNGDGAPWYNLSNLSQEMKLKLQKSFHEFREQEERMEQITSAQGLVEVNNENILNNASRTEVLG